MKSTLIDPHQNPHKGIITKRKRISSTNNISKGANKITLLLQFLMYRGGIHNKLIMWHEKSLHD